MTSCHASEVCLINRSFRGVRGYIDYQNGANENLREAFSHITRYADPSFDLFLLNVMEMGKYATACEIHVRQNEKEASIRGVSEDAFSGAAVEYNDLSVKAADRSRTLLKEFAQSTGDAIDSLRAAFASGQAKEALQDARRIFARELIDINIKPAEFNETLEIFDVVSGNTGSFDQLVSYLDETLAEFINIRQEPDRGNRPHSPLAWWKYLLIIGIIGGSIFGVIACFVWAGCSFLGPVLSAGAPWVFGIIDRGC